MNKEDKELLLKDLCARLPYGVKCIVKSDGYIGAISSIESQYGVVTFDDGRQEEICDIKPYLFPLSSMNGRQKAELYHSRIPIEDSFQDSLCEIDFYHRNHFDYRDLIEKSLALDATGLNIDKKE